MAARITKKETRLSFRVQARLKNQLEQVAIKEGRSVAQVAEVFLSIGLHEYAKKGSVVIQQWITRRMHDSDD